MCVSIQIMDKAESELAAKLDEIYKLRRREIGLRLVMKKLEDPIHHAVCINIVQHVTYSHQSQPQHTQWILNSCRWRTKHSRRS